MRRSIRLVQDATNDDSGAPLAATMQAVCGGNWRSAPDGSVWPADAATAAAAGLSWPAPACAPPGASAPDAAATTE